MGPLIEPVSGYKWRCGVGLLGVCVIGGNYISCLIPLPMGGIG